MGTGQGLGKMLRSKKAPIIIDERKQEFDGVSYHRRKDGYYKDRKGRQMHRAVWAYHWGDIPKKMLVHHIDGDPSHNQVDNLEVLTVSQHLKHHYAKDPTRRENSKAYLKKARAVAFKRDVEKTCIHCGGTFMAMRMHAKSAKYCSSECSYKHSYEHNKSGFRTSVCPVCKMEFEAKCRRTKTCSYECGWELRRKRNP